MSDTDEIVSEGGRVTKRRVKERERGQAEDREINLKRLSDKCVQSEKQSSTTRTGTCTVRTTMSLLSRLILVKSGTIIPSPTTTPYDRTEVTRSKERYY